MSEAEGLKISSEAEGRGFWVRLKDEKVSKTGSPWFVYILRCSDNSYYVGVANDITHRVHQHNSGQAVAYTKERRPVELVYSEQSDSYLSARRRERQLKGWTREKKERLIGEFPSTRPA